MLLNPTSVVFHELVVAPAALFGAWVLGVRALGRRRAALELVAAALYGFCLELLVMRVFASHTYGPEWLLAPLGVPLAVAAVWAAVILAAMALSARLGPASPLGRATTAATLGIALDLLMEPVAMRSGLWQWTPPGSWLGVPAGNFVGWALIVGLYAFAADHGEGRASSPALQAAERLGLGAACLVAVVGVGLAWRRLGVEEAFAGRWGWAPWTAILLLSAALRRGPATASRVPTLSARLATAPGPAAGVFALVAGVFGVNAVALGDRDVLLAAAGSAAVLTWLVSRACACPAPALSERASSSW